MSPSPSGRPAPRGDLSTFAVAPFVHDGVSHDVYRKGAGPAVVVIPEIPGLTPMVLGFADRLVALGCTAVVADLFGTPGRDPDARGPVRRGLYLARVVGQVCVSREFTMFALGRSSPVVGWLRALAAAEFARCGGPGVGVVGMCLTGGFALAMAVDAHVIAPVLSQPSMPVGFTASRRASIDCAPQD
ncbi:MAG: dienelactone hydrolase family protein, partial [Myxococcota bacterium]